ncbi:helix-turn-helix domain-containing protein [Emticicia sp. SJ17W-69]|uniref:helix-turn-helix domain-containing protein n=1 Tax=Emticicia sp. SJ17W-69 TaxID=3421657 RepID=UPI003EBAA401
MTYGTKLRKIRLEKGLSQTAVANSIGLDQSTYSRIESDLSEPKAGVLMKIAKFYEVEISSLYPSKQKHT